MATAVVAGADSTRCEVGMMVGVGVLSMAASGSAQMAEGGPWGVAERGMVVSSSVVICGAPMKFTFDLKRNAGAE